MAVWMLHRGHPRWDGLEMTVAMLVPMFALVIPVELGVAVPGLSEQSLPHVAIIADMLALMIYRWDRYARGAHDTTRSVNRVGRVRIRAR